MNNTIGKPPVRYYSKEQIATFNRWELMLIVQENGWEEITGVHQWKDISTDDMKVIIEDKMNEWKHEIK